MSHKKEDVDTYIIPPNFIDAGTVFGGMFKLRNVIEAGVIVAVIGLPVFRLPLSLTTKSSSFASRRSRWRCLH